MVRLKALYKAHFSKIEQYRTRNNSRRFIIRKLKHEKVNFSVTFTTYKENPVKGLQEQEGLKLNWTHQLLAYADDVNIVKENIDTVKKNT
jgi:hypothetical protein